MSTDLARFNISTKGASLPATYSAARQALEHCVAVDECKGWADKAQALKSYAKQAQDDELHKMAARIQGRAMRRVGELLAEIEPKQGKRTDRPEVVKPGGGAPTRLDTRKAAAEAAGLSRDQRVTALRVAAVPAADFERQIESDSPPTVTELARQGTRKRTAAEDALDAHLKLRDHMAKVVAERPEFGLAVAAGGQIRNLADFCRANNPAKVAHGFEPQACKRVREDIEAIRVWMGPFISKLEA